jgi:signal transduction histidine kinase
VIFSGVIVRQEALRDAEHTARAVADALVVPLADEGFHARDPAALARMTEALEYRARDGSITHIKVWGDAGAGRATVLWASEKPLVGQTFEMDDEEYALFGTWDMVSEVSDLTKEENLLERSAGQLVEVYTGTRDAAGVPIVFEVYISMAGLTQNMRTLIGVVLPLPLAALVVLSLATLPLAVSLAQKVDRGQQQMQRLLVNAVEFWDVERRRIAQDLHDGVVQDLAGVRYALASEARQLPAGGMQRQRIDEAGEILRRDLVALRTLMAEIYPPDLEERGLAEAIRDLGSVYDLGPTALRLEIDEPLSPHPLTARLAYRVIREALGNVAKHAHASSVVVRLGQHEGVLHFEVVDDGVGFDPSLGSPEGHFGLHLITEMVADSGGRLSLGSAPGAGTVVRCRLPL